MSQIHLNYYELSESTQKELKQAIKSHYEAECKATGQEMPKRFDKTLDEMFNLNNAGIDLDVYVFMTANDVAW